jgi:hypothetical protein
MWIRLIVAFIAITLIVYAPLSQNQEPKRSGKKQDEIAKKYKAIRVTPLPPDLQQFLADAIKQQYGVEPPSEIELYAIPHGRGMFGPGVALLSKTVVRGVVVAEREKELYLDVKPCDVKLFAIQEPYTKGVVSEKACGDKKHEIVVVTFYTPPARK